MSTDDDETREAVRQGVADGLRDDREARDGFGFERLRRAYERLHADYDPAKVRRQRRNQEEADDDAA